MANIIVPRKMPDPAFRLRRARNGMMASSVGALLTGQRVNWAAVHGLRKVHQDSTTIAFNTGTSLISRRGAFHSSETPGELYLVARCATRVNQEWRLTVDDGVGTTNSDTVGMISNSTSSTTTTFDGLAHLEARVAIDPDTAYTWRIQQTFPTGAGSIFPVSSIQVYEWAPGSVDTTQSYVADTRAFFAKGPIYDADVQKLVEAAHEQWKHGPQLISFNAPSDFNVDFTTTSASDVNMLVSGASTTVSSSTPGFNLPLTYHAPYHTTDIRAVLAVHARQDAGTAANSVKLVDSSGTLGTLSNFSNSGYEWKTTAVTLTGGASQKVDIHFACDGTNELSVDAVALYIRET